MKEKILQLKKEKNAVILAHYYAPAEAQEVADYVGDSFYLAKIAKKSTADIIVFCGVSFMGESAKILNPDKKGTDARSYGRLSDGAYGEARTDSENEREVRGYRSRLLHQLHCRADRLRGRQSS